MRFTEKDDFLGYTIPQTNAVGDKQINIALLGKSDNLDEASVTVICQNYIVGEPIRQFGRIEDVLGKHDVGSAEELDLILEGLANVHQENANLKNELAELKQKAIVPKFNVGDYFIEYWDTEPSIYRYKGNNHFECLNKVQGYHCDYIVLGALLLGENFIKKISKEEAEQKLAEIKGEKL